MPKDFVELVFATNNHHKLIEVQALLGRWFRVLSLADIGFNDEIPEDAGTLQGNALQKARHIYSRFGYSCFADDTGLEVDALNGKPGVYSARYAGEAKNPRANVAKLLKELHGEKNRHARFRTVIALILNGNEHLFDGKVEGEIVEAERGSDGFGYDPVFLPSGCTQTFAEMPLEVKNRISHRGQAIAKLVEFLGAI